MGKVWLRVGVVKGYNIESDDVKNWWKTLLGAGMSFEYVLKLNNKRKVDVIIGVSAGNKSLLESLIKSNFDDLFLMDYKMESSPTDILSWKIEVGEHVEGQMCDWNTLIDMMAKFGRVGAWISLKKPFFSGKLVLRSSLRNKRWLKSFWNVAFEKSSFKFVLAKKIEKEVLVESNALPWPMFDKTELGLVEDKVWFYDMKYRKEKGLELGNVRTDYLGDVASMKISEKDRMRHMYILGKTGVGKSTLMYNMFMQDVLDGKGCCVVDPHGDLVEQILKNFPRNRVNDLVILDPTDSTFPFAFNILDNSLDDSKDLVVAGVIDVFKKLYGHSWGPRMEYIMRNALMALVEVQGQTLLSLQRFLVEDAYRGQIVKQVKDPVVRKFWDEEFGKLDNRAKKEYVAPILNKIGQFMSVSYIRNILGQVKSKVDFFWMMNKGKVVLIKLPKGQLGEENATLLGAMMLTFLQLQVMRRQSIEMEDRRDFYLYVDEFQNFATSSFEVLLSEARKYGLGLVVANQFLSQLEETTREALLGNVGTLLSFRLGLKDAELISKYLGGNVHVDNLLDMPKFKALVKTLVDGEVAPVFTLYCKEPFELHENKAEIEKILRAVRDRYTTDKSKVEEKIGRFVKNQD